MYETAQKEQFSRAYVAAVLAAAGCNSCRPDVDDDSVDLHLMMRNEENGTVNRGEIDLQLKCTATAQLSGDTFPFPLKIKNYDDLRCNTLVPRLLLVVCIPEQFNEWLCQTEEELCLRKCAYWYSLRNMPEVENQSTVTVQIPRNNIFSVEFLKNTMQKIANGEML